MRKTVTLLLAVIMVMSILAIPAAATDCSIKDYNISLSVPDDWYIINRDTPDDAQVFTDTGVDPDGFKAKCENDDLYLELIDPTLAGMIFVSVRETEASKEYFNLEDRTEEELTQLADKTLAEIEENNDHKVRTGYGSYIRNGVFYMVMCYWEFSSEALIHHQEFRTYYNGLEVSVEMVSPDDKTTQEESDVQSYIVNHLKFSKTLKNPNAALGRTTSLTNYIIVALCAAGLVGLAVSAVTSGRKNKEKNAEKKAAEEAEEIEAAAKSEESAETEAVEEETHSEEASDNTEE